MSQDNTKGKITIYEGIGKTSKKPFTALRLDVGRWSKLYFVQSDIELEYLKSKLDVYEPVTKKIDVKQESETSKTLLDDDDELLGGYLD